MGILGSQVHLVVQVLFPNNDAVFQDNLPIHKARSVQSWFEQHEDAFPHLLWLAQSPTLNIIWTTVVSLREQDEKQIISQATRRVVVKYSTADYSEFTRSLFQERYMLCYRQMVARLHVNKEMCIFHSCSHYGCPSPVHAAKLYSLGWLDKLCRNIQGCW